MAEIKIKLFNDDKTYLPVRAHDDDACYDLFVRKICLISSVDIEAASGKLHDESDHISLCSQHRCLVKTGVYLEMPEGWEALVRPRSGLALKSGITVLNSPGTIDSGYRNEVGVILYNTGDETFNISSGMRIAQIAFRKVPDCSLTVVTEKEFDLNSNRNLKGFGSSGL